MKPCSQFRKAIAALPFGTLKKPGNELLRQHLNSCPACREWAERCTRLEQVTRDLNQASSESELPKGFHERLMQRVRTEERPSHGAAWMAARWFHWWTLARAGVIGGAIAIVVVVGVRFFGPPEDPNRAGGPTNLGPTALVAHL